MTFEQKVQLWMVVGTWFAGLATLAAVLTALYFARRGEKVRLKIYVGIRQLIRGDGSPGQDHVCFDVTNVGQRPVTITTVGWVVGKRKKRKYCVQPLLASRSQQCPVELTHGENAHLMISLTETPNWASDFSAGFINDPSGQSLKTLKAQIFTSVGQTFEIKPESDLIDRLRGKNGATDRLPEG